MSKRNIDKVVSDLDLMKKFESGAWIVTYQDKAIVLSSGKSIWKRENHAKSAFTNHISTIYSYDDIRRWGFKDGQELSHYIQELGLVKIKQL